MSTASRDNNNIPTLLAASSSDGTTPIKVTANVTTGGLSIADGTTGTDHGTTNATRDENFVPALMAVSSSDGVTPVVVYADSNGNLLVDSN